MRRLRHPLLRRLPATFTELAAVAGYGTLALVMAMLVWLVLAAPFLAVMALRDRDALRAADPLAQVGEREARQNAAVDGFRMFVIRP